jgi:hypothetical protein
MVDAFASCTMHALDSGTLSVEMHQMVCVCVCVCVYVDQDMPVIKKHVSEPSSRWMLACML